MTHDGGATCKQLEEYLISKLAKDHSGVKLKVLRIIRYICENNGSIEFRRLIQRRADQIRQAQSFRGVQDPLNGDAPNKAVRDEANATMQSLFAAENSGVAALHAPNPLQARIQSMGSSDYSPSPHSYASAPASTGGPRHMESMGNPYFNNYGPQTPAAPSLASIMQSDNRTRDIISAVTSGMQSVVDTITKTAHPYLPSSSGSQHGGGYGSSPPAFSHPAQPRSDWIPPRMTPPPMSAQSEYLPTGGSSDDSSTGAAQSLVNELCLLNAARVVPTQQSLDSFVGKCESSGIDPVKLGIALVTKLADPAVQWVHKMKVLAGITALHQAGLDAITATVAQQPAAILSLLSSPQCGAKAKLVAQLLGLIEGGPPVTLRRTPDDLLDLGQPDEPAGSGDLVELIDGPVVINDSPVRGVQDACRPYSQDTSVGNLLSDAFVDAPNSVPPPQPGPAVSASTIVSEDDLLDLGGTSSSTSAVRPDIVESLI